MYYVSFPGLGIEPFHIDKVAFSVFGKDIAWYGILITLGMIIAVSYAAFKLSKYEGLSSDDVTDLGLTVIVFGVIGARFYYVLFTWNTLNYVVTGGTFWQNLWGTIYNCIAMWEGGLAIYGGVIAGLISAYVFSRIKKIKFIKLVDILSPCVLIGQVIGRWGNFINIEAYGSETTLPWRMGIEYIVNGEIISEKFVHPTFLYESLWNIVLLIVIICTYKKKKFDGQFAGMYFAWYGLGRMMIEGLRTDSLMLGNLRVSQGVGFISMIVGILMLVFLGSKSKKERGSKEAYESVYKNPEEKTDDGKTDNEKND